MEKISKSEIKKASKKTTFEGAEKSQTGYLAKFSENRKKKLWDKMIWLCQFRTLRDRLKSLHKYLNQKTVIFQNAKKHDFESFFDLFWSHFLDIRSHV